MLETLLRRERIIVLAGLVCITLLAWVYLIYLAQDMARMDMPSGDVSVADLPVGDMPVDSAPMDMAMPVVMPQMQAWQTHRVLPHLRDVVCHDGCDDGTLCRSHDLDFCRHQP